MCTITLSQELKALKILRLAMTRLMTRNLKITFKPTGHLLKSDFKSQPIPPDFRALNIGSREAALTKWFALRTFVGDIYISHNVFVNRLIFVYALESVNVNYF